MALILFNMQQNQSDGDRRLAHLWARVEKLKEVVKDKEIEKDRCKEQSLRAKAYTNMKGREVREYQDELENSAEYSEERLDEFDDLHESYKSALAEFEEANVHFRNAGE